MIMEINMPLVVGVYFSAFYAFLMIVLRLKKIINTTIKRFFFIGLNVAMLRHSAFKSL